MKWPFRRDSDTSNVPAEIQEYYQTERRERTGVAWLLALGTLLVTIGLAAMLFFGGRWLYRTIANRDDNKTDNTSQVEENRDQNQPVTLPGDGDDNGDNGDQTANNGDTSSTNTGGVPGTQSAQTDQPATTPQPTTPATGESLPNTGPDADL